MRSAMNSETRVWGRALLLLAALTLALPSWSAGAPAAPGKTAPDEAAPDAAQPPGRVLVLVFDTPVTSSSAELVSESVARAEEGGYEALVLVISTPGGLVTATRDIATALLSSEVPILTYVHPPGTHAASAGTFITMAGHVAAMAPATNIGAAHPVTGGGKDPEEAGGVHMGKKIENDLAAFARAIAKERGRNVEWAERAVRDSVSVTADEALELKVIDLVVESVEALLTQADGRVVTLPSGERTLHTAGATQERVELTVQQQVLRVLSSPEVFFLLGVLGMLGLMIELQSPGLIVPGVIGAFFLLLAAIASLALPVSVGAVVLLLVGVGFLVAEVYTPSFGLLTAGGAIALTIGALLLMDGDDPAYLTSPSLEISPWVIVPTLVSFVAVGAGMAFLVFSYSRRRPMTGREALVGQRGVVRSVDEAGRVRVFVAGELWWATGPGEQTFAPGAPIEVARADGMQLEIALAPEAAGERSGSTAPEAT